MKLPTPGRPRRSAVAPNPHRPGPGPARAVAIVAALTLAIATAFTAPPLAASLVGDYQTLLASRYAPPVAVPEGGFGWEIAGARFTLGRGTVALMEPTSLGEVTGFHFEGAGRFEAEVADAVELRQLRRFAEDEEMQAVRLEISEMLVRTADPATLGLDRLGEPAGPYSVHAGAREQHADWRKYGLVDVDARIAAAARIAGDRYVRVAMKTEEHGWLVFTYDELRPEEIELTRFAKGSNESWLALDRPDERDDRGRPTSPWSDELLEPIGFEVAVDVTRPGKGRTRGVGAVNPGEGAFETGGRYRCEHNGAGAVRLALSTVAQVERVWRVGGDGAQGSELEFVRYHVGGDDSSLPNDLYDDDLTVALDVPCLTGEEIALGFTYEMELDNYASLLSWYPTPRDMGFEEPHTMQVAITHRKDYQAKGMGELVSSVETDGGVVSTWRTKAPVDAAAFTIARLPHEKSYEYEGLPTVVMFGTRSGSMSAEKIEGFSADIINAINYFQQLFGSPIASDTVQVTFIASGHGQAGEGLIQVSDSIAQAITGRAVAGVREAFLAHEVAHEWWGHQLSWASYRDQWLSEGFAEYSAMLFVAASLEGGDRIFRDILESYTDELTGSLGSAFGAFSRPGVALINKRARERMGPIGHGFRARTAEAPTAYSSMAYNKGAMVLHMLRVVLRTISKSDELFFTVLRDFVATHRGQAVSTEDFQAVLSEHAPSDWSWFFDQWVYGTEIPTFSYDWRTEKLGGGWKLVLDVEMRDVPDGWRVPVPVRADFGGGESGELLVMVDSPRKTFELVLPARPKEVVFNPDFAVLAKMK